MNTYEPTLARRREMIEASIRNTRDQYYEQALTLEILSVQKNANGAVKVWEEKQANTRAAIDKLLEKLAELPAEELTNGHQ